MWDGAAPLVTTMGGLPLRPMVQVPLGNCRELPVDAPLLVAQLVYVTLPGDTVMERVTVVTVAVAVPHVAPQGVGVTLARALVPRAASEAGTTAATTRNLVARGSATCGAG